MNIVTLSSHFTRSQIGIHDKNNISFVMQILSAFQMNPKRKKTQKWSQLELQLILMKIVNDSDTQIIII